MPARDELVECDDFVPIRWSTRATCALSFVRFDGDPIGLFEIGVESRSQIVRSLALVEAPAEEAWPTFAVDAQLQGAPVLATDFEGARYERSGDVLRFASRGTRALLYWAKLESVTRLDCALASFLVQREQLVGVVVQLGDASPLKYPHHLESAFAALTHTTTAGSDIPPESVESIRDCALRGEMGVALEDLCAQLIEYEVPVTSKAITELARIGEAIGIPPATWEQLRERS